MTSLHVLFADDHRLFRKGVIAALKELRPQWSYYEAENGQDAINMIASQSINIVLLDVSMPVMDGQETCRKIKQEYPDLPVIMLTMYEENSLILHLLQFGINGYLLKNTDPEKVVEAIEVVMKSGRYVTDRMIKAMETSVGVVPEKKVRLDLTPRDKEIINFLCRGLSTKAIASHMHLTETSVESYRKDLMQKTCTRNVAELISFAHRTGLLSI
ncbi:MAG TPA: response regulator transcription factor [Cyclobacteriaceae bacterium]